VADEGVIVTGAGVDASGADRELLVRCFTELTGAAPESVVTLRPHASQRRLYRLVGCDRRCVGVVHGVLPENDAFVAFAGHFRGAGLPVPEVYLYRREEGVYLQQDLGDLTLFDLLTRERERCGEAFPPAAARVFQRVVELLPRFQIEAANGLDFSRCYPNSDFSSGALQGDFAQFSGQLVARLLPHFDTTRLQNDFSTLIGFLARAAGDFFVYRDCQSRNIMVVDGEPFFIDFQGGRRGPLQYDLVSLLYQASARLPQQVRAELCERYIVCAQRYAPLEREEFLRFMGCFVVSRMVQVLGVYGREGLGAGKEYFAASIPGALDTLQKHLVDPALPIHLPELTGCCEELSRVFDAARGVSGDA
jgi:aminoglycoside/choline kinase family phosphotransferase